ncbi:MAG: hypothetical protein WAW36_19090 [Methylovulum miyakonense]|uniref:hypothetical protein n=1 Tax=Methylovulum miyakonense TaxID=645578 RepID=UPI003BB67971
MTGWKTWTAAILWGLYGVAVTFGWIEPNAAIEDGIKALGLVGLGHKLEKAGAK